MRKFSYLSHDELDRLFYKKPTPFCKTSPYSTLRAALGALLYMPASTENISGRILSGRLSGAASISICLEDAIGDDVRQACVENVKMALCEICLALTVGDISKDELPLIFVRVKDIEMLEELSDFFMQVSIALTGVILPKASCRNLKRGIELLWDMNQNSKEPMYLMPILEAEELVTRTDRIGLLQNYKAIIDCEPEIILNVRVGATDLCGLYGIRRSCDSTIYDIGVTSSCLSDIVRVFGFRDEYTVSSPVWEYFTNSPFPWETLEIQGLIRETRLNLANGMVGKTAVHPNQLAAIEGAHTVTVEEYQDALTVQGGNQGVKGVLSSVSGNKMNELKPHSLWAKKILKRAEIYGVFRNNDSFQEAVQLYFQKELNKCVQ